MAYLFVWFLRHIRRELGYAPLLRKKIPPPPFIFIFIFIFSLLHRWVHFFSLLWRRSWLSALLPHLLLAPVPLHLLLAQYAPFSHRHATIWHLRSVIMSLLIFQWFIAFKQSFTMLCRIFIPSHFNISIINGSSYEFKPISFLWFDSVNTKLLIIVFRPLTVNCILILEFIVHWCDRKCRLHHCHLHSLWQLELSSSSGWGSCLRAPLCYNG